MNLYVGNLNFDISEEEIRALFEQVGEVANVRLMIDRETGVSKGYGFVEMNDVEEYVIALKTLNGREFGGRNIVVNQGSADSDGGKKPQSRPQQRPNNNSQSNRGYSNQGGGYNNDRPRGNYNSQGGGYNNDRPRSNYSNQGGSGYNNDRPRSNYNNQGGGYNNDRPRSNYNNQGGSGYNNDRPSGNYNQGGGYNNNRGYDSNRPPRDNIGYSGQNSSYNRSSNEPYREIRPIDNREGYGSNRESGNSREGGYGRPNYGNRENVEPRRFDSKDNQSFDRSNTGEDKIIEKLPTQPDVFSNEASSIDQKPQSSAKRPRARVAAPEKVEKKYSSESKDEASE
jgi:RNA recognition motif-containing protein